MGPQPPQSVGRMSQQTILIVEDHEDARFVLATLLDCDGYRIIEAKDGAEGVALASSERPDLILMDIRMPVMDGLDASEAIRSEHGLVDVPIIAVTAEYLDSARRERADSLFEACLLKPVPTQVLLEHVRGILGDP